MLLLITQFESPTLNISPVIDLMFMLKILTYFLYYDDISANSNSHKTSNNYGFQRQCTATECLALQNTELYPFLFIATYYQIILAFNFYRKKKNRKKVIYSIKIS